MSAMEKVAWVEVGVTTAAVAVTAALLPWLGDGAWGAFGLLGLLGVSALFVRPRRGEVIIDERDRVIEQRATRWGLAAAWQLMFMSLIGLIFWSSMYNESVVPTRLITWLVWLQFATCYWVKGAVALRSYRRSVNAA